MREIRHHVKASWFVAAALATAVLLAPGCARGPAAADPNAPVIYDLAERIAYAHEETPWTELDLGSDMATPFLLSGWGEIKGAPDGTLSRWTRKKTTGVRLFLPEPRDLTLQAWCDPYVRRHMRQWMNVLVNGKRVARLHVKGGDTFVKYEVAIPAEALTRGENVISFKARYISSRHKKALRFSRLKLKGLEAPVSAGAVTASPEGPRQNPGTRAAWCIVAPTAGYLKVQPVFAEAGDGNECVIHFRSPDRRIQLASYTGNVANPETIPIANLAGTRGMLEFEVFGTSVVTWEEAEIGGIVKPEHVNVILLTVDTLLSDHVGFHGYERDTTPNMDRLAARGTAFLHAYANSNESVPSHACMLTGRYPQSHGLITNGRKMNDQQITLARMLSKKGYATACYVNFPILRQGNTTGKGFDRRTTVQGTPRRVSLERKKNVYSHAYTWVKYNWQSKFFMWVHSQFLHMEDVPPPYKSMYCEGEPGRADPDKEGRRIFPFLDKKGRTHVRLHYNKRDIDLTDEEIASVVAYYDGGLRFSDELVGLFLDSLKDFGLDPFTAIVLTSDHGVSLGRDHCIRHRGPPYDHFLRVPLIFVLPGSDQAIGGKVDGLVESIDIAPTILSYIGMKVPHRIQGQDLMPALRDPSSPTKEYVFATTPGYSKGDWFGVRSEKARYHWNPSDEEFLTYDFDWKDPVSVADQHPEDREKLRQVLFHWIKVTPDVTSSTEGEVSDEIKEMLRKAGYLDDIQ